MPEPIRNPEEFLRRIALWAIVAASLVVRIALVLNGGQYYYPDESRYWRSFDFIHRLVLIDPRGAVDRILGTYSHVGFIVTGVPFALVHIAYLGIRGLPETQASVDATVWVSGICFALPSVISIVLIYAISRRAAGTSAEALLAAFLFGCSNAMFYYCRHLLPYDLTMALALFALWLGIAEQPSAWVSFRCGFVAGLAILTYNGYWITGAMVLAFHVLYRTPGVSVALKRAALAALGAVSLPVVLNTISLLLGRRPYLSQVREFAGSVNQGDFREGAVLPFLYLWHAEYAVALMWAAAALLALWYLRTDNSRGPFVPFCLVAALATYGMLAFGSVGLGKFVVYGRLVRQIIPWLCFVSAYSLARVFHQGSKYRLTLLAGCAALVIQAGFNMSHPFRQIFPAEVIRTVHSRYGDVSYDVSFQGPSPPNQRGSASSAYVLLNAQLLYPLLAWKPVIPEDVLISFPHPYAYRPYRYEGLSPRERDLLQHGDYSMRLIRRFPVAGSSH
jgi:hypothetical protein